ncbi:large subunit terminase [Vibrio phage vB_VhaM_VH-8]|nr:large subunit terminase [Vibrio phage vB_VhaM_VH-8]
MEAKPLFEPASRKQEMFINSQTFRTVYGGKKLCHPLQ